MQTVEDFFAEEIDRWEVFHDKYGKLITYQDLANDAGNRKEIVDGKYTGRIVGTNWGCTAGAVATYRNIPIESITVEIMKALTRDEAIQIGIMLYYKGPGFDKLPWCAETSIWCAIGWGSGTRTAIKAMQKMIGVAEDGSIGPATIEAYKKWVGITNKESAVTAITEWRIAWYNYCVQVRPSNSKFLKTWLIRANFYRPSNPVWWNHWTDSPENFDEAEISPDSEPEIGGKPSDVPEGYTKQPDGNVVRENVNESPTVGVANKGMWISGIITSIFGVGGIGTFFKAIPEIVLIIVTIFGCIAGITLLIYFLFIKKRRINDNQAGIR